MVRLVDTLVDELGRLLVVAALSYGTRLGQLILILRKQHLKRRVGSVCRSFCQDGLVHLLVGFHVQLCALPICSREQHEAVEDKHQMVTGDGQVLRLLIQLRIRVIEVLFKQLIPPHQASKTHIACLAPGCHGRHSERRIVGCYYRHSEPLIIFYRTLQISSSLKKMLSSGGSLPHERREMCSHDAK